MALHAAADGIKCGFTPRPGAVSHRKPINIASTDSTRAVVRSKHEIVISDAFANAVRVIYTGGNIASKAEGAVGRLIDLVVTQLHGRKGLPTWNRADVEVALSYLADTGQITLPSHELVAS